MSVQHVILAGNSNCRNILSAPQTLTGSWVDIGDAINTMSSYITVWIDLSINDSLNVRLRPIAKQESAGDDYVLPIITGASSLASVDHLGYEFAKDEDQKVTFSIELVGSIPVVQLQVMAVTPGATPGVIERIDVSGI